MEDFVLDLYHTVADMLWDWPTGTLVGGFVAVATLFLCGLILWLIAAGIVHALDSWFRPLESGTGVIAKRTFVPRHSSTIYMYNAALKMSVPQTMHYPDAWHLGISKGGKFGWIQVSEETYDRARTNAAVPITFVTGRLSDDIYIRTVAV